MKPRRTPESNVKYKLPGGTAEQDLPCYRPREGLVVSEWELTHAERLAIAAGGRIELGIYSEPIPPVHLAVVMRDNVGGEPVYVE